MTGIKPEMIEKATRLTDWSQHEYRVDVKTWIPYCICGWTATEPYDVPAYDRHMTETVLATVADDLRAEGAAQALREAADAWQFSVGEQLTVAGADRPALLGTAQRATNFLRARAEQIEARDECPDCGGDPSLPVPVDSGFCHARGSELL